MGRGPASHPIEKLELLRGHFLLRHLSDEEFGRLTEQATTAQFAAGQMIFEQGDAVTDLMVVIAGRVKLSATSADGRELLVNFVERGHAFGEIALIDGQPRSFDAVAVDDSEVAMLPRRSLAPFLGRPEVCALFMKVLCERLRRSERLLQEAVFLGIGPRLARQLLRLASRHGRLQRGAIVLDVELSQEQLASLIGMTRESINKQLGAWRRQGIIDLRRGEMSILRPGRLRRIAGGDGLPPEPGPSPFLKLAASPDDRRGGQDRCAASSGRVGPEQ